MNHVIPPLEPAKDARSFWPQPDRDDILVTDDTAVMSQRTFEVLQDFSRSYPAAKAGRMWKAISRLEPGKAFLFWYGPAEPTPPWQKQTLPIHRRPIIIQDWKRLLGIEEPPPAW